MAEEANRLKWAAGATPISADIKSMLVNYEAKLILKGLNPKIIQR